ncbi:MAG: orotate phosphoribosyltransferase [Candidatus Bathyarchaeia archaeon]
MAQRVGAGDVLDKTSLVANALFRSGALKFGAFKLKSGMMSPYYIDLTWLLSSPRDFECIVDVVADDVREVLSSRRVDRVASIELKGALLLPSIANKLNLPCLVVRKGEKGYGVTGRIAGGEVEKGEYILFFDDVVSSGESKLEGIEPLEALGAKVEVVLVVVDREQGGREMLEKRGYELRALTKVSELANALFESKRISKEQAKEILNYVEKTAG